MLPRLEHAMDRVAPLCPKARVDWISLWRRMYDVCAGEKSAVAGRRMACRLKVAPTQSGHTMSATPRILRLCALILLSAAMAARNSYIVHINVPLKSCFYRKIYSTQHTQSDIFSQFCKFNRNNDENYFIYFTTELYCIAQTILMLMIYLNIIEAFVYYKIFQFINR